jgi:hypothetical protein
MDGQRRRVGWIGQLRTVVDPGEILACIDRLMHYASGVHKAGVDTVVPCASGPVGFKLGGRCALFSPWRLHRRSVNDTRQRPRTDQALSIGDIKAGVVSRTAGAANSDQCRGGKQPNPALRPPIIHAGIVDSTRRQRNRTSQPSLARPSTDPSRSGYRRSMNQSTAVDLNRHRRRRSRRLRQRVPVQSGVLRTWVG